MKKPLQNTLKFPPPPNNEDNIPWNNTKNTYQALHTKKTQTSKDRIKREQTARKQSLYTPSARKRERGGKSLLVLEVNSEGQVCELKCLVLLFGYGKELVWSIFPCWLEYRARGILVRYWHKVEREIAQDLKTQVWVNWVYRTYSSPSKCKSVNVHWPLYWA